MSKNTAKKWALGTVFAAVAGYVTGVLTAPKSGKETRKEIKDVTLSSIVDAEKQLKKLHTQLSELITEAHDNLETVSGKAKKQFEAALSAAKQAKTKAREMLSTVHEGDTGDQDLQKAISDATKAFNHLKTYLKKPD